MHHHYEDIRDLIDREPDWFDEYGVPRYASFAPDRLASISAQEAALAEIACQACERRFKVAFSPANHRGPIARAIVDNTLHYHDPPNVGCCATGPTMNSMPRRVLEYWSRSSNAPLPDPREMITRLRRDGPLVQNRSQEDWAREFARDAESAATRVESLSAEHETLLATARAEPAWRLLWKRYPIFETMIYPDWIVNP